MFCCDLCALTPLVLMLKNKIYSLQSFLLQSEEELLGDRPSNLVTDTNPQNPKKLLERLNSKVYSPLSFSCPSHIVETDN